MLTHLAQYYGLDWVDAIGTILGIYLLGDKKKFGFVCNIIGACAGVALAIIILSLPIFLLNLGLIVLNIIGYVKWKNSPH